MMHNSFLIINVFQENAFTRISLKPNPSNEPQKKFFLMEDSTNGKAENHFLLPCGLFLWHELSPTAMPGPVTHGSAFPLWMGLRPKKGVGVYFLSWDTYNIVKDFARRQHEWAVGIHMSPLSCTHLPSSPASHPFRWSQSTGLSSLHHAANSHWLSILHMVMYMFQCYSLKSSHPLLPEWGYFKSPEN